MKDRNAIRQKKTQLKNSKVKYFSFSNYLKIKGLNSTFKKIYWQNMFLKNKIQLYLSVGTHFVSKNTQWKMKIWKPTFHTNK